MSLTILSYFLIRSCVLAMRRKLFYEDEEDDHWEINHIKGENDDHSLRYLLKMHMIDSSR